MKRKNIAIPALVLLFLALVPACNLLEDCGTCELVTVDADGNTTFGAPQLFCGDALEDKMNSNPRQTPDGGLQYWECY